MAKYVSCCNFGCHVKRGYYRLQSVTPALRKAEEAYHLPGGPVFCADALHAGPFDQLADSLALA